MLMKHNLEKLLIDLSGHLSWKHSSFSVSPKSYLTYYVLYNFYFHFRTP